MWRSGGSIRYEPAHPGADRARRSGRLPGFPARHRPLMDEMVVADTGSRDESARLARETGAKVLEMPWQDGFAAARNVGLAAATGDAILVLDAGSVRCRGLWCCCGDCTGSRVKPRRQRNCLSAR
ncbi:hypothetical protein DRQ50_10790 [bacterium]|nr:MAG: hypothetical protein DRQ50_10790 [bacterium]